jgi:hypothetical protein
MIDFLLANAISTDSSDMSAWLHMLRHQNGGGSTGGSDNQVALFAYLSHILGQGHFKPKFFNIFLVKSHLLGITAPYNNMSAVSHSS